MIISSNVRNVKGVALEQNAYPVMFVHVGVSESGDIDKNITEEREKIEEAIKLGADVICDVSMHTNLKYVHEKLLEGFDVPFGTVTIYEAYINSQKNNLIINEDEYIKLFEEEIIRGFDIITIHATVFKDDRKLIASTKRVVPTTSRGGMLMLELMEKNNYENPFFTHFDEILKLCKKYNVCLSLGPCYRPGSVCDCSVDDELFKVELERIAILVNKANEAGVGIAIEGIGHATLSQIPKMINAVREKCGNAPYRCMTVSTDIALGFDHISSAIASSMAIYSGADSVTCVSRSEHIGIPSKEETLEAVQATAIAIYSGYIARTNDFTLDKKMSLARRRQGCIGDISATLFPSEVREIVQNKKSKKKGKSCSMCGSYCPLNSLEGE